MFISGISLTPVESHPALGVKRPGIGRLRDGEMRDEDRGISTLLGVRIAFYTRDTISLGMKLATLSFQANSREGLEH